MLCCAAIDCLIRAETWLSENAPDKLATVVHEDGTMAKKLIKTAVKLCRNNEYLDLMGSGDATELRRAISLPLRHIIDTVHFADKPEARPLQLADLCAFIMARAVRQAHVPPEVLEMIGSQAEWFIEWAERTGAARRPEQPS